MSTRGSIARLNADGSVDSVYLHFDSYPSWAGYILKKYHNNKSDVDYIIENGDISHIERTLCPKTKYHSFDHAEPQVTVFYKRDRNESGVDSLHWNSLDDWLDNAPDVYDAEYLHVWTNIGWRIYSCTGRILFTEEDNYSVIQ